MSSFHDRAIYHFTHVGNLPSILRMGYVASDTEVRDRSCLTSEVGHLDIKARRRAVKVGPAPGGVVADYVPFYFAPRSPMLYVINKNQVAQYTEGQAPLVYCVTTIGTVLDAGLPSVFTDGNAAHALSSFNGDPMALDEVVDWPLMGATMWGDTDDDRDRKRRRMAEFLVHGRVPVSLFTGFGVIDERTRREVADLLVGFGCYTPVRVRRDWYY